MWPRESPNLLVMERYRFRPYNFLPMSKDSRTQEPKPDGIVAIDCAGLHPDEIVELQRSLERSRYDFEVGTLVASQTYDSLSGRPSVSFLHLRTKLLIRFSLKKPSRITKIGKRQQLLSQTRFRLDYLPCFYRSQGQRGYRTSTAKPGRDSEEIQYTNEGNLPANCVCAKDHY